MPNKSVQTKRMVGSYSLYSILRMPFIAPLVQSAVLQQLSLITRPCGHKFLFPTGMEKVSSRMVKSSKWNLNRSRLGQPLYIQPTMSPVQVMVELLQPKDGAQQDSRK